MATEFHLFRLRPNGLTMLVVFYQTKLRPVLVPPPFSEIFTESLTPLSHLSGHFGTDSQIEFSHSQDSQPPPSPAEISFLSEILTLICQ